MLGNTPNQPNKLRTKLCVKVNDESYVVYSTGSQTKFKTLMLRSKLCNYSDAYILVKGIIIVTELAVSFQKIRKFMAIL